MKTNIERGIVKIEFLLFFILLFSCSENVAVSEKAEVGVISVKREKVPLVSEYVGEIKGLYDIPIRARVDGILDQISFREGEKVQKGQLLYVIDDQPLLAKLANSTSQLASAKTELVRAKNELKRLKPLAEINAVSKMDLDAAIAMEGAAKAQLNAAKANLELAQIQLSYSKIYAPISGTIGRTMALKGEYVGKDPNPVILNTISQTDSVKIQFFLSETEYLELARYSMKQDRRKDSTRSNNEYLQLVLTDGTVVSEFGRFDFIDRNVDPTTGAIMVQCLFPNPNKIIKPGQFGKLRYTLKTDGNSILIPQRCVLETQGRFSVFVVNGEGAIESKVVEILGPYQDYFIISKGLLGNERIVLEGLQKIRVGDEVEVVEAEFKSNINSNK